MKNNLKYFLYIFLLGLSLFFSYKMTVPLVPTDESCYLYYAKCFASLDGYCSVQTCAYGYSFLLAPLSWVGNVLLRYKLALFLNSLIASFVFWLSYFYLKKRDKFDEITNSLISFVVASYPAVILSGNTMMTESLFIFVNLLIFVLLYFALRKPSALKFFFFAFIVFFSFLIRGNALISLGFALLLCVYLFFTKYRKYLLYAFFGFLFAFILKFFVEVYFFSGDIVYGAKPLFSFFDNLSDLYLFFPILFGQLFYISLSSFFIIPFLFFYYFQKFFDRNFWSKKSLIENLPYIFVLFVFLANWILLSLLAIGGDRGDQFFYGRYLEGYIAPLLLVGLEFLFSYDYKKVKKDVLIFVLVFFSLSFFLVNIFEFSNVNEFNILSFVWLMNVDILNNVLFIFAGFSLLIFLVYLSFGRKKLFLLLLSLSFLLISYSAYLNYFYEGARFRPQYSVIPQYLSSHDLHEKLYFDENFYDEYQYFLYKFMNIESGIEKFDFYDCDFLDGKLVVSSKIGFDEICDGAKLLALENHRDIGLWRISSAEDFDLNDFSGVLTDFSLEFELLEQDDDYIKFIVRNTGSEPWLNWWGIQHSYFSSPVRIALKWLGDDGELIEEGRIELERTVFPGDELIVDYSICDRASDELVISLFKEGDILELNF